MLNEVGHGGYQRVCCVCREAIDRGQKVDAESLLSFVSIRPHTACAYNTVDTQIANERG